MEDLIDKLRDQRLQQTAPVSGAPCIVPPKSRRSDYVWLRTRLRAGLVGSIVLMIAVACLVPLYIHRSSYLICYIVVQLITIVRVLIAIQMNIPLRHIDPSHSVSEVAAYVDRLELIHHWDRRYTLYVKVPLTICVVTLLLPLLGLDPFAVRWVLYLWVALTIIAIALNFVVAYRSFLKLEKSINNLKNEIL
jgi:hypothetical protein